MSGRRGWASPGGGRRDLGRRADRAAPRSPGGEDVVDPVAGGRGVPGGGEARARPRAPRAPPPRRPGHPARSPQVPPRAEEITIPADVTPERVPTHIVDYSGRPPAARGSRAPPPGAAAAGSPPSRSRADGGGAPGRDSQGSVRPRAPGRADGPMGVVLPGIGLGCSGRPPPPCSCREPSTGSCWGRLATPSAACPGGPWGTTSASFRVTLHGSLCSGRLTPPPQRPVHPSGPPGPLDVVMEAAGRTATSLCCGAPVPRLSTEEAACGPA